MNQFLEADDGSSTIEYAIAAIAAATFAGLLILIIKSEPVSAALSGLIQRALSAG